MDYDTYANREQLRRYCECCARFSTSRGEERAIAREAIKAIIIWMEHHPSFEPKTVASLLPDIVWNRLLLDKPFAWETSYHTRILEQWQHRLHLWMRNDATFVPKGITLTDPAIYAAATSWALDIASLLTLDEAAEISILAPHAEAAHQAFRVQRPRSHPIAYLVGEGRFKLPYGPLHAHTVALMQSYVEQIATGRFPLREQEGLRKKGTVDPRMLWCLLAHPTLPDEVRALASYQGFQALISPPESAHDALRLAHLRQELAPRCATLIAGPRHEAYEALHDLDRTMNLHTHETTA